MRAENISEMSLKRLESFSRVLYSEIKTIKKLFLLYTSIELSSYS